MSLGSGTLGDKYGLVQTHFSFHALASTLSFDVTLSLAFPHPAPARGRTCLSLSCVRELSAFQSAASPSSFREFTHWIDAQVAVNSGHGLSQWFSFSKPFHGISLRPPSCPREGTGPGRGGGLWTPAGSPITP